jgi:hypothetical protein
MKNAKFLVAILIIATSLFSSCKKEDLFPSFDINTVQNMVKDSKWKIIQYTENGTDETYKFSGYEFTFKDGGAASAIKSGVTTNGSWSARQSSNHLEFIINFGTNKPLDEISDDWHFIQQSGNTMKFEDVSGGNGDTETLVFEKI